MTEELLSADRAAGLMDTDCHVLESARLGGHVIGLHDGASGFVYPDWQFRFDGQPYADVKNVVLALGGDHARAYEFMTAAHGELGGRKAREHLRTTRNEDLADLAVAWGARGATSR